MMFRWLLATLMALVLVAIVAAAVLNKKDRP